MEGGDKSGVKFHEEVRSSHGNIMKPSKMKGEKV
ncbi:hypothetical protein NEOCIP111885_01571 [Pseudoneobacillus rhizosphaerae]|jgi:hypothetical protein|uniref:Uncharacterized protein n=1 Tax=Pseudoneobacillus rhizosphaerae TaxID=2880968 RepID=A0A9C7G8G2_9BACI|nr:hypothetical protein NEOCIP111885_01571 [Pseudoneobacillus rhizosphaerae]